MSIHVEAEDWMMTAALIGLSRLFPEDDSLITKSGVQLRKEHLEQIPTRYFNYLIEHFSIVERDVNRMSWNVSQVNKNPEKIESNAKKIRDSMKDQYNKVVKYFSDTPECKELQEIIESLKLVKKPEDAPKVEEAVNAYERIMSTTFINEKLTLNYAKAMILGPIFGQPSFLQPTFNAKTRYEHESKLYKDFIQPAEYEIAFQELRSNGMTMDKGLQFLQNRKDYKPFKDWHSRLKKLKTEKEFQDYIGDELLPCSFIDDMAATQSFEEMVFSPLALSKDQAVNFNWNFNKNNPIPISALARLLFFLTPIGLTFYTRRLGTETGNEILRFAGVVLSQQAFSDTLDQNNTYFTERQQKGNTFGEAIVNVLDEARDKAEKRRKTYLFVEFFSDYQAKKTLLDYYHMPTYLTDYLSKYGKTLSWLNKNNLRDQFLRTAMKGQDTKQVIFAYLRLAIKENYHTNGAYHATKERRRILEAKKRGDNMTGQDKKISFIYFCGADLRKEYVTPTVSINGEGPYRASGQKKLERVAYRLLNAVKAGNKNAFMDTIFRVYMGTHKKIPSIFVELHKEEGLDFETIASAFITGLLAEERKQSNEEVTANE